MKNLIEDSTKARNVKMHTSVQWKGITALSTEEDIALAQAGRGKYLPGLFVPQVNPHAGLLPGFM